MNKTLIAYFSHAGQNYFGGQYKVLTEGNTKRLAKKLQALTNADIFEIEPKKTYPEYYKECCDEALAEQKQNAFVELKNYLPSIETYENIVLAYPCWWGTMPRAVFTFLAHYDFSKKNIYPICTHEGSGMGSSVDDLKRVCKGNIKKWLAVRGSAVDTADSTLASFVSETGIKNS